MIGGDGRSLQPSSVLCVLLLAGVVCTASGSLYQHLHQHSYQQRHRGGSSATCTLNSQLVAATIVVATTSHPTHLHLVFQDMPDSCLVGALWDVGVGVKLMEIREWRESLSQLSYLASSQHLLVGNLTWLTHIMRQVHPLYSFSKINALKTHWLWVATDVKETLVYPPSYTSSPSSVFSEALLDVSDALVEGVRGLLIATSSRNRLSGDPSVILPEGLQTEFLDTWVMIGGVDAPGDGSWRMRLTATMTSSGLKVFSPLWPDPPTNFHLRPFRIACIKKPKVFEFDDGDSLEDAGGYIVEMMHVLRQHFNFSGLLVPTEGFGLLMPNGSWNGMVGVLQRREADMAALDFTPSWARTAVVDFSLPIGEDIVVIISRAPSVIIRPFLLLQIFSPFVWACIIGMALMVGVVLGVVTWAEGALSSSAAHARLHVGIMEHTTNVLKIHIAQGHVSATLNVSQC
ncbi:uncharacterized protein LOC121868705 [Homarus americanus]|uniref:uncharacterized protein LOC121868705 n=1 Tax=Homarus americanus TaxID=6706 RepID=UPI001C456A49|nr:uncharacterized protein LOC121868705 [Homarus americanus]